MDEARRGKTMPNINKYTNIYWERRRRSGAFCWPLLTYYPSYSIIPLPPPYWSEAPGFNSLATQFTVHEKWIVSEFVMRRMYSCCPLCTPSSIVCSSSSSSSSTFQTFLHHLHRRMDAQNEHDEAGGGGREGKAHNILLPPLFIIKQKD